MVGFERVAVGAAEGGAEFFRGVGDVGTEGLGGEIETTKFENQLSLLSSEEGGAEGYGWDWRNRTV